MDSVSRTVNENASLSTTDNARRRRPLSCPVVCRSLGARLSGTRRRRGVAVRRSWYSTAPRRRRQNSPFRPPTSAAAAAAVVVVVVFFFRNRVDGARPATCFRCRSITSSGRGGVPGVASRRRLCRAGGQPPVFRFRRKSRRRRRGGTRR